MDKTKKDVELLAAKGHANGFRGRRLVVGGGAGFGQVFGPLGLHRTARLGWCEAYASHQFNRRFRQGFRQEWRELTEPRHAYRIPYRRQLVRRKM